jgi:C-methyltransferase
MAGGRGHLLGAIVERHPDVNGMLFELPEVIDRLRGGGAIEVVRLIAGDFFADRLPTADVRLRRRG